MTIVTEKLVSKSTASANILVIDDNMITCKSLVKTLSKHGYLVDYAQTGTEALKKAQNVKYNVAILDLELPDIEGTNLLDQFSDNHPNTVVIITTENATLESAVKAVDKQVVAYVRKPIDMNKLERIVSEQIEKQILYLEKVNAERALQESENRYRALAEESNQGIAILQNDGVIYANGAVSDIFGYDVETLLDLSAEKIWEVIHPDDMQPLFESYQRYEESVSSNPSVDFRIIRSDGEIRYVEAFASIIESQGEDAIQILMIDRTRLRKSEEAKILHQKEIEIYNSILRHDLGNDLQIVLSDLEFIDLCTSDLSSDVQEALESALAGAERMFNLVTVLNKPVDDIENSAVELIKRIAQQSERAHSGLSVSLTTIGNLDELTICGSRLLPMVFINIFSNAIKHAGNEVQVEVCMHQEGNHIVVDITDDGPGVDAKICDDLFKRGVSTTGGGLGLYLSKRIIEAIDGKIEYVSQKGSGAQFRITLPLEARSRS